LTFDVISFLTEYNIEWSSSGKNVQQGWVGITCPMPDCGDVSDHGGFNLEDGHYYCWKCGAQSVQIVIKNLLNCTFAEADRIYRKFVDKYVLQEKKESINAKTVILPGNPDLMKCDVKYLKGRGFDPDYIKETYRIKGSDYAGDWMYRIIIPIYYQNKIVSFQGRDVTNKQYLRYKTLEKEKSIVDPKSIFYGLDDLKNDEIVGVVEGVFDRWRMGKGFIASLGKNITDNQVKILKQFKRVFFLIDSNDEKSKGFAVRACEQVSAFGSECVVLDMENGKDPGELTEQEVKEVRREIGI
jgi:DNA primase